MLIVGAVMLAVGFTLPFIVGTLISSAGYTALEVGGIALMVIGYGVRAFGKRAAE